MYIVMFILSYLKYPENIMTVHLVIVYSPIRTLLKEYTVTVWHFVFGELSPASNTEISNEWNKENWNKSR